MGLTDNLRRQHKELLEAATKISKLINSEDVSKEVEQIYNLLSALDVRLHFHLIKEDESLYPALLTHRDKKISTLTKQLQNEVGGLLNEFHNYMKKWQNSEAIQDNTDEFIKETTNIFVALAYRIDKEDNELFSLLDRL
jgi:iron-sulfur cluster repair protein YtfE (RIC family)